MSIAMRSMRCVPEELKPYPVVIRILTTSAINAVIISWTTDIECIIFSEQELYLYGLSTLSIR
jgi:hypothetical protein